jgi:hypothetical protein
LGVLDYSYDFHWCIDYVIGVTNQLSGQLSGQLSSNQTVFVLTGNRKRLAQLPCHLTNR